MLSNRINEFNEELGEDDILEDLFVSPSILFGEESVREAKK